MIPGSPASCSCLLLLTLPCLLLLIKSGVAQDGESARLINERVRVQVPPPRPKFIRGYDLTG